MLLLAGLAGLVGAQFARAQSSVTLAWDPSSSTDVAGYNLYYGGASQSYTNITAEGNQTSAAVSNLVQGATYYFAVTAVSSAGLESVPSAEVKYTIAAATNNTGTSAAPVIALTAPATGTAYAAPATISFAASVTPNGHTISKVQFLNSGAVLGESAAAPYSFQWTNVAAGSYSLAAQAVYDGGTTALSGSVTVSVTNSLPGLPPPWQTADIGKVGLTGSATISNSYYTVVGAGDLTTRADSFRYLYQGLSGDGEIRGQIYSAQQTSGARVGAMLRENLSANSTYALMAITDQGVFRWQARTSTGGKASFTRGPAATPPNAWVRLVRSGNTISGYESLDGVNWTLVNSSTVNMAANIYVGWAVASGSASVLNTSVFSNGSVVP